MNATESASWLADRTSELEAAQGKLASLETHLAAAETAFSKTNGDPRHFIEARDRRDHLLHQVEQTRQAVATCQSNVDCARQGLARATREARISELTTQRAERRAQANTLAREALDAYEKLVGALQKLDGLQASDPADVSDLYGLGERVGPFLAANALWLELMNRHDGQAPAACVQHNGYFPPIHDVATRQGLAAAVSPLFEMTGYRPDWIPSLRASLGDLQVVVRAPEHVTAPPKPAQLESYREFTTERYFTSHRYCVEVWHLPPDGRVEHRLMLSSEAPRDIFGTKRIVHEHEIELEFDLKARLVKLADGSEILLAPAKPSLLTRAVDAIVDAVSP